jgi:hypothetical protein
MQPEETMTARFSEDVRFQRVSFEVWGPEGAAPEATATPEASVSATEGEAEPET